MRRTSTATWNKRVIIATFFLIFFALAGIVLLVTGSIDFAVLSYGLSWQSKLCISLGVILLVGSVIAIIVLAFWAKKREHY